MVAVMFYFGLYAWTINIKYLDDQALLGILFCGIFSKFKSQLDRIIAPEMKIFKAVSEFYLKIACLKVLDRCT